MLEEQTFSTRFPVFESIVSSIQVKKFDCMSLLSSSLHFSIAERCCGEALTSCSREASKEHPLLSRLVQVSIEELSSDDEAVES